MPLQPPPSPPTCEHSSICRLDALQGHDGKCILHSEKSGKEKEAFEETLEEHRQEREGDFRYMVFPSGTNFRDAIFVDEATFENATFEGISNFRDATFEGEITFANVIFEGEAYFRKAIFEGESIFENATFEGEAYFRKAIFEDEATFGDATFKDEATFRGATFEDVTHFSDATFENATFENAIFKGGTYFASTTIEKAHIREATFEGVAYFRYAIFGDEATFENAIFEGGTYFGKVTFENAIFESAIFENETYFREAIFEGESIFRVATFKDEVHFRGATFENATFEDAVFKSETYFGEATFEDAIFENASFECKVNFGEATFEVANFFRATFNGGVSFNGAFETGKEIRFEGAVFSNCEFGGNVLFAGENEENRAFAGGETGFEDITLASNAELHFRYADLSRCRFLRTDLRDVEFTGVQWCEEVSEGELFSRVGLHEEIAEESERAECWVDKNPGENEKLRPWSEIERLYRELKKNYEEKGDFPRAGDFHIGEKEARRRNPNTNWGPWLLLWTYRILSKYGERALPAALWLVGLVFGFALLYYLSGATTLATVGAVTYPEALIHSLEATFYPVRSVGFLSFWPQFFSIVQRVTFPVIIALLALALRQRVKR